MAFTYKNSRGNTYYLHERSAGKNGKGKLFYFAKEAGENTVPKVPSGYEVTENQRTGLPILKKEK